MQSHPVWNFTLQLQFGNQDTASKKDFFSCQLTWFDNAQAQVDGGSHCFSDPWIENHRNEFVRRWSLKTIPSWCCNQKKSKLMLLTLKVSLKFTCLNRFLEIGHACPVMGALSQWFTTSRTKYRQDSPNFRGCGWLAIENAWKLCWKSRVRNWNLDGAREGLLSKAWDNERGGKRNEWKYLTSWIAKKASWVLAWDVGSAGPLVHVLALLEPHILCLWCAGRPTLEGQWQIAP